MTKKFFLLFAFCIMAFAIESNAKKYPVLRFEKTTIDFGELDPDNPVATCVFTFTNVGKAKLIINQAETNCGCTVANFTTEPISPGGTGTITVKYDGTGNRPGRIKKSIRVYSNSKDGKALIFIQGELKSLPREQKNR